MDAIRVRVQCEEVPVILEMEDGTERSLMLREMIGKERDKHLQSMASKVRLNAKGEVVGLKTFDGLQAGLLARCLYDESGELLPIEEIQGFPTTTQVALFNVAQEIKGLNLTVEEAKND